MKSLRPCKISKIKFSVHEASCIWIGLRVMENWLAEKKLASWNQITKNMKRFHIIHICRHMVSTLHLWIELIFPSYAKDQYNILYMRWFWAPTQVLLFFKNQNQNYFFYACKVQLFFRFSEKRESTINIFYNFKS